ncbi:polyprenol monophosphomannose synthase [Candidatus Micrarchaeota archaeon]|nr:polyprenol monophosphomannose synthase [Candidatus Micrarchaeota archaeon]
MLSIIIPTYNEKENIAPLLSRIEKALASIDYEVVFVDDNSPDGTAASIRELSQSYPNVRVVVRSGKLGLTSAVLTGVKNSKGEKIVVMDADLSHPPEKIPELFWALKKSDLVIASRMLSGGGVEHWPFYRRIISSGAELMAKLLLWINVSDPLSGFFGAKRSLFEKTRFRTNGYKLLLNILSDNRNSNVLEIPYFFTDRYAGQTKLDSKEALMYLRDLFFIRFR